MPSDLLGLFQGRRWLADTSNPDSDTDVVETNDIQRRGPIIIVLNRDKYSAPEIRGFRFIPDLLALSLHGIDMPPIKKSSALKIRNLGASFNQGK